MRLKNELWKSWVRGPAKVGSVSQQMERIWEDSATVKELESLRSIQRQRWEIRQTRRCST